jgi:polar amino acid transport system substrate-binding protein
MALIGKIASAILACGVIAASASAQESCTVYVVRAGDTLSSIASRVFGNNNYVPIYEANRAAIGPTPNTLEIGVSLRIPCRDGRLPGTPATTAATVPAPAPAPVPVPATPPAAGTLTFVALMSPPFSDPRQPGFGLAGELVTRALETRFSGEDTRILTPPPAPPAEALEALTGSQIGFAWYRPDCRGAGAPAERFCSGYVFSDPIFELRFAILARAGSLLSAARRPADLARAAVCIPRELVGPDPVEHGLVPADARLTVSETLAGCLAALAEGRLDAVLANADILGTLPAGVRPVPALAASRAVVLVAPRNGVAEARMREFNAALREITAEADWAEIVVGQLQAYRAQVIR